MAYDNTTQTTGKGVFNRLINRLTDATFMGGAGNVWDVMQEYRNWTGVSTAVDADAAKHRHSYVLKGGEADGLQIFVGLAYSERQAVAPFPDSGLQATSNTRLFGFHKYVAPISGVTVQDFHGPWDGDSFSYNAGDIVEFGGANYLCVRNHTSTNGANAPGVDGGTYWTNRTPYAGTYANNIDSLNVGDFVVNVAGTTVFTYSTAVGTVFAAWNSGTTYTTGARVTHSGVRYRALTGSTNQNPASTVGSFWAVVLDADVGPGGTYASGIWTTEGTYRGAWTVATSYVSGQFVEKDGLLYECILNNQSTGGNNPGSEVAGSYWLAHTPHYRSQHYGGQTSAQDNGRFTPDEGFIDNWQTGLCWAGFHKTWQSGLGDIPLWIVAHTRRFLWVTKSGTSRWYFSYAGLLKPFGTDCTNPYPLLLAGNAVKDTNLSPTLSDRWWQAQHMPVDYVEEDNVSGQDGYVVGNYPLANTGTMFSSLNLTWVQPEIPYPYSTEGALELTRLPTGENYLRECWLHDGQGFVGALDGVYWVAAQGMASGDIITANAKDYLLVEDIYRGSSGGMFAICLE